MTAREIAEALQRLAAKPMKSWDAGRCVEAERVEELADDLTAALKAQDAEAAKLRAALGRIAAEEYERHDAITGTCGCVKCIARAALASPGEAKPGKPTGAGMYYILDIREPRPDWSALWWRPDGKGYTTDIDQAGLYTFEEATSHRDTDIAVPFELAQRMIRRTVEKGALSSEMARVGTPIKFPPVEEEDDEGHDEAEPGKETK